MHLKHSLRVQCNLGIKSDCANDCQTFPLNDSRLSVKDVADLRSMVFLLTTFPVEILLGDNKLLLVLLLACDILLVHNNWLSEKTGVPLVHKAALVMPHMDED